MRTRIILFLDLLARKPYRACAFIFVISAFVRLTFLTAYILAGNQLYSGEAENIARSLVVKMAFADPFGIPTGPSAHCSPLYPAIAAVIYGVFGRGFTGELARCVVNILVLSLLYSLFPWIALRFGLDFRAGLLAGMIEAALPTKRSVEIFGMGWEAPYAAIVLAVLLIWTLSIWRRNQVSAVTAFLWGMGWGAATLLQTSLFLIYLVLCAAFLLTIRAKSSAVVGSAVLGCVLILVPWTIRNRTELGAWIFIRSNLGIEMEVGNHEGARPDVEENISSRVHPFTNLERAREVRTLGEVEYNRRALRRAVSWIHQKPVTFLRLSAERCFRFWFSSPLHPLEFGITLPIMLIGLWGMLHLSKTHPQTTTVWLLALIAFSLIYYVTQYSARYRAVVEWMPMLAAGQTCFQWLSGKPKGAIFQVASTT